jgi:predicted dehydrogenase
MIKVGIIGAGFMGTVHSRVYAGIPDIQVTYIVDTHLERAKELAQEVGGRATSKAEEVFKDDSVAIVDICLPTPLHSKYVIDGLEAGKHVVVEKPLALTLEESDQILAAVRKTDKFLMVAHVLRFWPEYLAIRDVLNSGEVGAPIYAVAQRLSNYPQWATWFQDPKQSGGVILDLSIHDLDMMNWLFGRPKQVYARGVQTESGDWGYVITQVDYGSLIAVVECSYNMPLNYPFTTGLRILFEKGVLEYFFRAGGASFEQGKPIHYLALHEMGKPNQTVHYDEGDGFEREITYFVNCVRSGQAPTQVTPQQAHLAVKTALLARRSLEEGEEITFPED